MSEHRSPAPPFTEPYGSELLTTHEVAGIFRVRPRTVTRWAARGKLTTVRTAGGHYRYIGTEVKALFEQFTAPQIVIDDPTQ